jgi:glycosyltransferase involved in cell wall biosynthesis
MAAELLGHLGERLVVYYVADDYLALPGIYRRYVGELERALLDRADVIFATSEVLCDAKEGRRGRPVLLPHGVDLAHWTPRVAAEPPPELAALPCPRIGFFGFLAPWVDDRLMVSVARAFPHASVVLIGPAWAGVRAPAAPNITWLGPRSYAELPQYAEHFDVALLPFRRDRLVSAVNPLKLLEYLALGLPVVSTPMALPPALARLVYVAADTETFVGLVLQALRDDTAHERSRRRAAAAGESWVARVRTIRDHIDAALAGTVPTAADVTVCSPTLSPGLA